MKKGATVYKRGATLPDGMTAKKHGATVVLPAQALAGKAFAAEKREAIDAFTAEKLAKVEKAEKVDKVEKVEKIEKIEKVARIEKVERPEKVERTRRN
ncbi:hypothetical protein TSA66_01450 [Noviherbaspirillum autotrophicum]|uniref:Uncharacterized protein n=1 Tax=Noviherbaspirillum autotrophicum TaxID=709839 RepID=A0A0C1YGW5_9BURK|nr:hypothetical protein TSA66_01450 [Noviherbaspirillum autotrophicum]